MCGLKLKDLAQSVEVREYATVAMAVKRFETSLKKDKSLQEEYRRVMQMLNIKM
jgi:chromosomal replication initiation ATPase DnaA